MEVRFHYTEEEWVDGRKVYLRFTRRVTPALWALLAAAAFLFLVSLARNGMDGAHAAVLTALALCGAVLAYGYAIAPRRFFRATEKYSHEYILRFFPTHIEFETEGVSSRIEWTAYVSYWETGWYFYLFQGKFQYVLIPKRAFASAGEKDALAALLREKLGAPRYL